MKTKAGSKTGSICQDCKCTVHLHMETTGAVAWEPEAEKLPRTWKVRPAKYFKPGTSWLCDPLGPGHLWLETWELDPGTWGGKCLEPGSPRWEMEGGSRAWYTWENSILPCIPSSEYSRILKVYPPKASTNVLCELVGAFELSGGKNEIVAIILLLTSDSHLS